MKLFSILDELQIQHRAILDYQYMLCISLCMICSSDLMLIVPFHELDKNNESNLFIFLELYLVDFQ